MRKLILSHQWLIVVFWSILAGLLIVLSGCTMKSSGGFAEESFSTGNIVINVAGSPDDSSVKQIRDRHWMAAPVTLPSSGVKQIWLVGTKDKDGKIMIDNFWAFGHEMQHVLSKTYPDKFQPINDGAYK